MAFFDPSKYEPLLTDRRLEQVESKIRQEFKGLDAAKLVTFVQPPRTVEQESPAGIMVPRTIDAMAVFAIVSPNPKRFGQHIMSTGTALLETILEDENALDHYAGSVDSPHRIFRIVASTHLKQMADLEALIN